MKITSVSQKGIRAIVMRFSNDICADILKNAFEPFAVEFAAALATDERHIARSGAAEWEYFASPDVKVPFGTYPVGNWDDLAPLDEELLEQMRFCEVDYMHMMSRFERKGEISYYERKRSYLHHLRFWNDYLERKKINLYVGSSLPHEIPEYIIYCLCKLKGIPTFFFNTPPLRDTLVLMQDWEESVTEINDAYHALQKKYATTDIDDIPLQPKFQEYYDKQTNTEKDPFWYLKKQQKSWFATVLHTLVRSPLAFLKELGGFAIDLFRSEQRAYRLQSYRMRMLKRSYRKFYDAHATEPDFDATYIYIPLHVQPECSTCPMAGMFMEQILEVQMLSALLPDDVYIYVKENPYQDVRTRSTEFYQQFLDIPRVRLMPYEYNTFRIMEHATAIATCTGTVGFESMFRGLPVLMFGHRFYQYGPGIYQVHTTEDCSNAIRAIFENGETPDLKEAKLFLKALEDVSIDGALTDLFQGMSQLQPEENIRNVSAVLREYLRTHLSEQYRK